MSTECFRIFNSALSTRYSALLLDHLLRPHQHVRWDRQTDGFRCFQIDDELELHRLLDWNVCGLGALEDLIHVDGSAPEQLGPIHTVGHEPPVFYECIAIVHRRQPSLGRKVNDPCPMSVDET